MPMFARKYAVQCDTCHAAIPRLNFAGFKFKAAGFRMPWEVDKEQDAALLKLENYTAFIAVLSAPLETQADQASQTSTTTVSTSGDEIDVHPMTGSWGKSWAGNFELDALSSGSVNLNQAALSFTAGSADSFETVQAGVTPNLLGFGPLDRPAGVSSPLILSASAGNSTIDTLFGWSSPRAAGFTGSFWWGDSYLSLSLRNRLAATGSGLDALGGSGHMGDALLTATQFLDHVGSGSALSLFYYKGLTRIPTAIGSNGDYDNSYNHVGLAANKYVSDRINVLAGGAWNADQRFDVATAGSDQNLHSYGTFGGVEYFWSPTLMAGGRFDQFRSDTGTPDTMTLGGAGYVNWHVMDWVILAAELQYLHNERNTGLAGGVNGATGAVDQYDLTALANVAF